MSLTITEVEYFAELARLDLNPDEIRRFQIQLSTILDYFRELQEVSTQETRPTSSVISFGPIYREDSPLPGLPLVVLLSNAPDTDQDQFRLPPVFE